MTASIEKTFGVDEGTITPYSRLSTLQSPAGEPLRVFTRQSEELDQIIHSINSIDSRKVNRELFPDLKELTQLLKMTHAMGISLPTLTDIAQSQDPEVIQATTEVFNGVKGSFSERWEWLDEHKTSRTFSGAFLFEAYGDIATTTLPDLPLPQANGSFERMSNQTIVRALEQMAVWRIPRSLLVRSAERYFTEESGFKQEFIDYAQSQKLFQIALLSVDKRSPYPALLEGYLMNNPEELLTQVRELDEIIHTTNSLAKTGALPEHMNWLRKLQPAVAEHGLHRLLGTENQAVTLREGLQNMIHLKRVFKDMDNQMKIGESVQDRKDLPPDILESGDYIRTHFDATGPKPALTALMIHAVGYYTSLLPQYEGIRSDDIVDALVEVAAVSNPYSTVFQNLYHPEHGHDWVQSKYGFSPALIENLQQIIPKRYPKL